MDLYQPGAQALSKPSHKTGRITADRTSLESSQQKRQTQDSELLVVEESRGAMPRITDDVQTQPRGDRLRASTGQSHTDIEGDYVDFDQLSNNSVTGNGEPSEIASEVLIEDITGTNEVKNAKRAADVFPYDPINSAQAVSEGYPKLDFKPLQIRTWFLIASIIFFLACVGSIVTMILLARKNNGSFHTTTTKNHLAFRYVPAAVGTVTTLLWRTVITALGRLTPFISMASPIKDSEPGDLNHRKVARTLENSYADAVFGADSWNFWIAARNGHWLLFVGGLLQALMMLLIVPLKASFIQLTPDETGWVVVVYPKIGHTLISVYAALIVFSIAMVVRLWDRETGLRWDPVSLADQLALVQGSNAGEMFQGLEFANRRQCSLTLVERSPGFGTLRLGYWKHRETNQVWHGIAFIKPLLEEELKIAAVEDTRINRSESAPRDARHLQPTSSRPAENQGTQIERNMEHYTEAESDNGVARDFRGYPVRKLPFYRHRDYAFMVSDSVLIFFAFLLAIILALTATGLINHRVQEGIQSSFKNWTSSTNPADLDYIIDPYYEAFVFRFLPVLLMVLFSTLWINIDRFYRYIQPFASMNDPAPATSSILLDYPSGLPVWVSIKAAMNGHWRVALFSILALGSTVPPIIATGVFVSTDTETGYLITIEPLNFWASFALLLLYVFCLILARPTEGYRLPRYVVNICDVLSYCYASRILTDLGPDHKPILSAQAASDTRVHLESRIHLAKGNYMFGLYYGTDRQWHLGFDVAARTVDGRVIRVLKIDPGWAIYWWPNAYLWFGKKRPSIVFPEDDS